MWIGTRGTLPPHRPSIPTTYTRTSVTRLVKRPSHEHILAYCDEDPIERVFLADVAHRGLGRFTALKGGGRLVALLHAGANVVPSGRETAAFADVATRARPRMIVGEERAV